MLKRCYSLILLVFFLVGCSHNEQKLPLPVTQYSTSSTNQYRQVAAFNQVDVQGQINIHLHTGYKKPQVILTGDPRDLAQVNTVVSNGTLYLALGKGFPRFGAVNADIRGRFLNGVRYVGAGSIRGSQLHTSYLNLYLANPGTTRLAGTIGLQRLEVVGDGLTQINGISSRNLKIYLKGNPKVQLTGFANLARLNIDGDAWLSLYWIKSNNIIIRAKKAAKVQLAGVVNRLDVELWGVAQFKGRYLRAQRSFVKTHDKSVAEISAVNHQSNLATDASDIYYFNIPTTRADFMAFNGSVLDLREWSQFDMEDFNRYNKQFP
ncbi:GIN domain-containing protein [Legionella bononiensis]|uniref:DUF2807 domain-containing protein n=1 Tax=Legionella bononiensis TaxID=2793102 RepID=A0ABS1WG06_9GAMM|nr:DUF2807 domain-containing protein [Legionella bononiensis]MBL7481743.1 DUF2807 domain-containing protein [Legionella bononiensis]MBL7528291.1 DUF2807 domain-containing protein [Legionella bononiensis]MBL7562766.1 DUF2807 domain-containing protein [Legionella bononiensis]